MIETTMCMNCGDSMSREVIYNDIQLEVASHDVQGYERLTVCVLFINTNELAIKPGLILNFYISKCILQVIHMIVACHSFDVIKCLILPFNQGLSSLDFP